MSSMSAPSMPNALSTDVTVARLVHSDVDSATVSASTARRCTPMLRAAVTTSAARPGTGTVRVSKNRSWIGANPPSASAWASTAA